MYLAWLLQGLYLYSTDTSRRPPPKARTGLRRSQHHYYSYTSLMFRANSQYSLPLVVSQKQC